MNMDKFDRFSMCNCLTVRMDRYANKDRDNCIRTYTAHLMTPSLFLRKAKIGNKIDVPFKDFWPDKEYIKTYYIPKKINTFLLSTFNEIFHPNHVFGDGPRYVVPRKFRSKLHKKFFNCTIKKVKRISAKQYADQLKRIDKKVSNMWGPILKILVFYDYTRAPIWVKTRAKMFDSIAKKTVNWPVVKIKEKYIKKGGSWQHYARKTYIDLYDQITSIERAWRKNV